MLTRTINLLDALAMRTGVLIAPLTLVMVVLTFVVAVARYQFETGAVALNEAVMYMHGVVFMLGIAYTLKEQDHVRVDILYQKLSMRSRAIVDLLGSVFFLVPVCLFIFLTSLDYVSLAWSMEEASAEPGGLPGVYVLKTLIPLLAILLFLQGVAEILRAIRVLLQQDD